MTAGRGRALERPWLTGRPTDSGWLLIEEGFAPAREHEIESLFTVANGYLGTRGSLQEGVSLSRPATFVAGVYNTVDGSSELVVAPDWARLRVFVEGEPLALDRGEILTHGRTYDLSRGLALREWRHADPAGRVTHLRFARFASLADQHALVESVIVRPVDYSGRVSVEATLDGRVSNAGGVRHLAAPLTRAIRDAADAPAAAPVPRRVLLLARTLGSDLTLAYAQASVAHGVEAGGVEHAFVEEDGLIGERLTWEAEIGITYRVDKLVALHTSREGPEPERISLDHLSRLVDTGADALLERHQRAWAVRWDDSEVRVEGDEAHRRAARFAVHHLVGAANPTDERISIGARGLTGESYKGHVFWDTEIYMLPFYSLTSPSAARALLMYRYHILDGAREKARRYGYLGALYPWESTDDGTEATPDFAVGPTGEVMRILTGEQEHHVSSAVAYGVWQYSRATGDEGFLLEAGAEMLLETARFWASRATIGDDSRYHILKVIGPDEYHEGVDDNAYTNVMARWNIERAIEIANRLRAERPDDWARLAERLALPEAELDEWRLVAERLYTGFDPATGLFEQFRGYYDLEDVDLQAYEPRTLSVDVLLGYERLAETQIIKQPDVLLMIYLLWESFPAEVREANFRHYEPRCGHGSSLSPSIHALFAARLGDTILAERYYQQAAEIDLANNMGNAAGGVHTAAQGGLWQALTFGFGGVESRDDGLAFAPHLLPSWSSLRFPVRWRGRQLRAELTTRPEPRVEVEVVHGEPLRVAIVGPSGPAATIASGRRYRTSAGAGAWSPWREVPR